MKRRKVIIGGDEFDVMDEGNCFIETKRNRFQWREGELRRFAAKVKYGKPDKNGERKPQPVGWGYEHYTGKQILELYGDYDKGRGHDCWIRIVGVDEAVKIPSPSIEAATNEQDKPNPPKKSKQRQHGPDNRPQYNRRKNLELGNQLAKWFRKNKDATPNAGATWAETLFDRTGGILCGWKLPCKSVLWREAVKQKKEMRSER